MEVVNTKKGKNAGKSKGEGKGKAMGTEKGAAGHDPELEFWMRRYGSVPPAGRPGMSKGEFQKFQKIAAEKNNGKKDDNVRSSAEFLLGGTGHESEDANDEVDEEVDEKVDATMRIRKRKTKTEANEEVDASMRIRKRKKKTEVDATPPRPSWCKERSPGEDGQRRFFFDSSLWESDPGWSTPNRFCYPRGEYFRAP